MRKQYLCIDLKSFYASVECAERGLDPMTTRLVVADPDRTEKTICLAVSPALKALGIKNRCRVFEIPEGTEYIMAQPRMQKYIDYSADIYAIYLRYFSKEDIHVYSVDEAFMDATDYLSLYKTDARTLAVRIMNDIYNEKGIRATCGIGTNLYLTKIALDITAKHASDFIGELDEEKYIQTMWDYRPLTDFWRIGTGTQERLEKMGIRTMRDIARYSEDKLYKVFGIDAELLIDHAWGRETATIADIKAYKPETNCISGGQVLMRDYKYEEAKIVAKEMADELCLELVRKNLVASSATLCVGYSNALQLPMAKGTVSFGTECSSDKVIVPAVARLFETIVSPLYCVRRFNLTFNKVISDGYIQFDLFGKHLANEQAKKIQRTVIDIKDRFGKNAVFKGLDLHEAATARERNMQIGGHKSGV